MKSARNARTLSSMIALAAGLGASLYAAPSRADSTIIDFEGFPKGTQISNQYQATHGISFSIVNKLNGSITYPQIGETYNTDPWCEIVGFGNGGCGSGTAEGWVYNAGIPYAQYITRYGDRLSTALEPLTGLTHAQLAGRYFLKYPAGTVAGNVFLKIQYANPVQKAAFGIIDIDSLNEKWLVRARNSAGAIIHTSTEAANPNNGLDGDGVVRMIQLDVSGAQELIHTIELHYTGSAGPGLGFDFFLTQSTINEGPLVDAGPDQTVYEGTTVDLHAIGSDPDGDPLTYTWTQIGGDPVTLSGSGTDISFEAPMLPGGLGGSQTLVFEVSVSDGVSTVTDIVHVTVKQQNHIPVCDAGSDLTVAELAPVLLNGAASYDPDGDSLSFGWEQIAGPSPITLSGETNPQSNFIAPEIAGASGGNLAVSETYTILLTVKDSESESSCEVNVVVENLNHPPLADAGQDRTVAEATLVMLDGSASSDPDGDALTYSWSQIQNGAPLVTLTGADTAYPSFTAPFVSSGGAPIQFELVVDDGYGGVSSSTVAVNVQNINDPPNCDLARATLASLWPPNHKMIKVGITGVADPNSNTAIEVLSIFQDEPVNGLGDGDTPTDGVIVEGGALLRAERSGNLNGRVYHLEVMASDNEGSCTAVVAVCVPHDQKNGGTCIDDGALHDSTL